MCFKSQNNFIFYRTNTIENQTVVKDAPRRDLGCPRLTPSSELTLLLGQFKTMLSDIILLRYRLGTPLQG